MLAAAIQKYTQMTYGLKVWKESPLRAVLPYLEEQLPYFIWKSSCLRAPPKRFWWQSAWEGLCVRTLLVQMT